MLQLSREERKIAAIMAAFQRLERPKLTDDSPAVPPVSVPAAPLRGSGGLDSSPATPTPRSRLPSTTPQGMVPDSSQLKPRSLPKPRKPCVVRWGIDLMEGEDGRGKKGGGWA